VTDAHRKAVHDAERPAKYLLKSIMDRGRSSPGEWQLILASFWIPAKSLEGYLAPFGVSVKKWPATAMAIDAIFEELKRWEEAIKKFKVAVMRYLASSQFTQVVHMHRLVERYHIGDENKQGDDALQEANADAQDDDPSGGIGKVEYDSDADIDEHDEQAQTALLRREAESFLKMGKSNHADDDDSDEEVDADDDDDDDPDLKPERAVKKGGKMLRRRNAQQISRLKAQAANHVEGFDDSSESEEEMEGVDSDGMPKPARDKDDDRESDDEESRDYEFKPEKSADSGDDADDANDASKESEDASVQSDDRGKVKRSTGGSGAGDDDADDDDDEDNNDFDDDDDDGADGSDQPKKSVKKRAAAPKKEKTVAAASPPTKKAKPTPTSAPVAANPQPTPAPPPLITAADPAYDPFGDIDI
jgi:hypothetical protein